MSDGTGNPTVTNSIDLDPQFRYITMLPRDSALHSMANDGGRVGAELLTMVGKSGTFYGEPDFNSETQIPMWPFPNEDLAHKYLGQYEFSGIDRNGNSGAILGKRGFTTDKQTLTNYVWSYLENPTPPFDISITSAADSALLTWSYPDLATNNMSEKFSVFELINSEEKWLMDVNGDARHAIVNSSDSLYTVRAILSSGLSSDYSFHSERHEGRIDKPEGIVFKESVIPG